MLYDIQGNKYDMLSGGFLQKTTGGFPNFHRNIPGLGSLFS